MTKRSRCERLSIEAMLVAALAIVLLQLLCGLCHGGERERVNVAAAKTRWALVSQAVLPDTPPNVVLPNAPKPSPRGMSLEITGEPFAGAAEPMARFRITAYSGKNCRYCKEAHAKVGTGDARAVIDWTEKPLPNAIQNRLKQPYPFPVFVWEKGGNLFGWPAKWALYSLDELAEMCERNGALREGEVSATATRRLTADELRNFARSYTGPPVGVVGMTVRQHLLSATHGFIDEQLTGLNESELLAVHAGHHHGQLLPSEQTVAVGSRRDRREPSAPSAPAGAIQGREQIAAGLAWWRSQVGEGAVSVEWTRNGAQLLPLLRRGTWTPQAIYGTSGTFAFQLTGSTTHALPVDQASLDYRLSGGKLRLRGETAIDASLFGIDTSGPKAVGDAQPVGLVDPMTILSVASTVWGLLNPQADLTLPGAMSATAVMRGEELVITFRDAPSLRLVMLFTFHLRVESIAISETRVTVNFSGSRWIKSRSFEVQ